MVVPEFNTPPHQDDEQQQPDQQAQLELKRARWKQHAADVRAGMISLFVGLAVGVVYFGARDVVSSRQAPPPFPTPTSEGFDPDELGGTAGVSEDTLPATEAPTSPVPPTLPVQPTATESAGALEPTAGAPSATAEATATILPDTYTTETGGPTSTATELPAYNFPNTLDEALTAVAQKKEAGAHTYGEPLSFKFGESMSVLFINYALLEQPDALPGAVWGMEELQLYLTAFEKLAANPDLAGKVDALVKQYAQGSASELFLVFANVSAPPDPNYASVMTRSDRKRLLLFGNWTQAGEVFDGFAQLLLSNSQSIDRPSALKTGIVELDTAAEGSVEQKFRQEFDVLFHLYHEAFGHTLARTEYGMTELSKQFFTVFYTTQNGVNITLDRIEDPTPYARTYIEAEAYTTKRTSRDGVEDFADSVGMYLALKVLATNLDYQGLVERLTAQYKMRLLFVEIMMQSAGSDGPKLESISAQDLLDE